MWFRTQDGELRNLGLARGFEIVETETEGEFQLIADNDVGILHTGTETACERMKDAIEQQLLRNGLDPRLIRGFYRNINS